MMPVLASADYLYISIDPITIPPSKSNGDDCSLTWQAPTQRENGTALKSSEIAAYMIYAGKESGIYTRQIEVKGATSAKCSDFDIVSGKWFFAGITIDTDKLASKRSSEITKQLSRTMPPKAIKITGEIIIGD